MLLSIIIVHYNVKYFLEQCLCSLDKAVRVAGMRLEAQAGDGSRQTAEIFVVDNHSSDGGAEWLPGRFPQVQFILNSENKGFGAANNQALARAKGEYILFLNPDTILPEDCFSVCLAFMRSNPQAGAAGIRMIDGGGSFLKESRRGFPTPWVAFCKMTGLTALFPRSAIFAGYYLGGIPPVSDHPSPILSGAYMFVRKEALDKVGGFDERFFLYAEDIDLSYRIEQAGYSNYLVASTTILHFKGKSTPKDGLHIKYFYKAMSQFRRKHSRSLASRILSAIMEPAIWLRAGLQKAEVDIRADNRPCTDDQGSNRVGVCGDEQEAARVKALLSGADRKDGVVVSDPGEAAEIVFCEGSSFSFKEIISAIEKGIPVGRDFPDQQPKTYKIHASGTAAAVGNSSKKQRGEVIKL
jgi:N-acetylglucosaminyl-diphospho-decaprenol L-rhamnosyltransferase